MLAGGHLFDRHMRGRKIRAVNTFKVVIFTKCFGWDFSVIVDVAGGAVQRAAKQAATATAKQAVELLRPELLKVTQCMAIE